jgi:hypothetical protein
MRGLGGFCLDPLLNSGCASLPDLGANLRMRGLGILPVISQVVFSFYSPNCGSGVVCFTEISGNPC